MAVTPAGAQLAPVDLPPPPPAVDPREPSPQTSTRGRASRTPQRPRSPIPTHQHSSSRATSPHRNQHSTSPNDKTAAGGTGTGTGTSPGSPEPVLAQPVPRSLGSSSPQSNSISPNSGPTISSTLSPSHSHTIGYGHPHISRPSSPTSIHSSSSAIFERDVDLPAVASLTINPNPPNQHTLNHKASRLSHLSHGSALDHSVPAVLDDAVQALAEHEPSPHGLHAQSPLGYATHAHGHGGHDFEIEAPASSSGVGGIGMARQSSASLHSVSIGGGAARISSTTTPAGVAVLNSRSPSPVSMGSGGSSIVSPARSPPILGQLSTQQGAHALGQVDPSPTSGIGASATRPGAPTRISTGPQLPGAWTNGAKGAEGQPRPEDLTSAAAAEAAANAANMTPTLSSQGTPSPGPAPILGQGQPSLVHHLTNPNKEKRRISFLSYNDLLSSVPTTVTTLDDITSGNLSPDHLPGTVSPAISARSPVLPPPPNFSLSAQQSNLSAQSGGSGPMAVGGGGGGDGSRRVSESWDNAATPGGKMGLGLGDGEWAREGLGKGLEQRLDDLVREEAR